ncbi:MAG: hypothetical protein PWR29_767 [Methanolobus sp.]|jgi:hypothetical protein|nr:hypothetical protein [Methanolobus sp.]MDK2833542.1 hypothetical protein [Methanolobus sp.]MDK2911810.1 hypothetical protein [Methanolobus sp.]
MTVNACRSKDPLVRILKTYKFKTSESSYLPPVKVDCFGIRRMHGRIKALSLVIANEFFELFVVSSSCYQVLKEIIHLFHLSY